MLIAGLFLLGLFLTWLYVTSGKVAAVEDVFSRCALAERNIREQLLTVKSCVSSRDVDQSIRASAWMLRLERRQAELASALRLAKESRDLRPLQVVLAEAEREVLEVSEFLGS